MPSSTPRKKTAKKAPAKKSAASRPRKPVAAPETGSSDLSQVVPTQDPAGQDAKYAATSWATGPGGDPLGPQDLVVPSGQTCLVRRVGVQGLMMAGVLHNVDRLSAIVGDKHLKGHKGKGGKSREKDVDVNSLLGDPAKMADLIHTVDRVVCHVVLKPEIQMTPNDVTLRKPGVIYADAVDLVDKMFIFNFVVGGSRDLETFREGLSEHVGGVVAL